MILHNPLHAALSSNTQYLQITADNKDLLTSQNGTKFFDVRSSVVEGHLGEDLAVMQVNSGVDAFQLSVSGSHLIVRQNDNPGTADWPATFYTVMNQGDTAAAATKLATSRTFPAVNLAGTSGASFDGSENPTALGVTGTLPISHGGTGSTTAAAARAALEITPANIGAVPTSRKVNSKALTADISISASDVGAVEKTGDTMTGDLTLSGTSRAIKYASGSRSGTPIAFYAGDGNGSGLVIGDGGRTIIGGGESAQNLHNALGTGTAKEGAEEMHVASDGSIFLHTGCQTIDNRKTVTINGSGNVNAPGGFTGSLSGKATSADTADSAAKLTTARSLKTNLGSTTDVTFDGSSAQDSIPITGTLAVSHGGTGKTTASEALTALGGVPTSRKINTKALSADISLTASDVGAVPTTGGTVTGTLILSKTTDADGKSDKRPALIVGGQPTSQHIEIDGNEIMAKSNATTPSFLGLNNDGGRVIAGPDGFEGYLHGTADVAKKLDEPEYTDETDLNNLTTFGIYKFRNTVNNRPVNPGGTLIVLNTDSTYITQLAFSNSSAGTNSFHVRTHGANGWTAWQKVL